MKYGRYNQQGYFGESFVRVLASAAGLVAGKQDLDVTGVDFSFDSLGSRGTTRYPKIEAQVKSWSSSTGSADMWHYEMSVDHFNDLAGPGYQVPRYLFLILVPADRATYVEVDTDMLRLRHCGYWVCRRTLKNGSGTSSVISPVGRSSWRGEDALAQEVELRAAVHLPFDHFDAVDVAFHGAGTPGLGQPGPDGVEVGE